MVRGFIVRGLVLSAGRGSRLGAATENRPKALVSVRGRTLLERQVHSLRSAGASEVGCVVGWHADAFEGELGLDRLFTNPDWSTTSMVESLMAAEEWLTDDVCLVSYGDIIYSGRDAAALTRCEADIAIAQDPHWLESWLRRFDNPLEDAETFVATAEGWVTDIGRRPRILTEVQGQYIGLLLFTPQGWAVTRERAAEGPRDMTGLLGAIIDSGDARVRSVRLRDPWWEFDRPVDLELGTDAVDDLDRLAALEAEDGAV